MGFTIGVAIEAPSGEFTHFSHQQLSAAALVGNELSKKVVSHDLLYIGIAYVAYVHIVRNPASLRV